MTIARSIDSYIHYLEGRPLPELRFKARMARQLGRTWVAALIKDVISRRTADT